MKKIINYLDSRTSKERKEDTTIEYKTTTDSKVMNNKKIIEEFEEEISADGDLRYSTRVEPRLCNAEKTKKWIKEKSEEALSRQREEIIDEMVAEIFIRKDGILPLRDIYLKPNEIKEIREKLKRIIK